MITELRTKKVKCTESALAELRALVEQAEAGEIIAVTGVVEFPDGTYRTFGSSTLSRLQSSGALLEAAIMRLAE